MLYAKVLDPKNVPQSEPLPGSSMKQNNAGGYCYEVDDWGRLDRFLILGAANGSYYVGERQLTLQNAECVQRCLAENGPEVVRRIVEVSKSGRAPKNDPAIFALAMAASVKASDSGAIQTRQAAYQAIPEVCRVGTHIFQFAASCKVLRGWSRGLRNAIGRWYSEKSPRDFAYQAIKYQQRDGWSHRDLLRLSHPRFNLNFSQDHQEIAYWCVNSWPSVGDEPHPNENLRQIWAFEKAKRAGSPGEIVKLIRDYRLVRECVPTQFLNSPEVWEALLEEMPLTAMIRSLSKMTSVGLLKPLSRATSQVVKKLEDAAYLKKSRVHPFSILVALKIYAQGHGDKGSLTWTPLPAISDALDQAFYLAYGAVEPTNKRILLALDVSGSMGSGVAGLPLSCREATAAMALVTANVEKNHHIVGFSSGIRTLDISPRMRLDEVVKKISGLPFDRTDCAQPMLWANKNKIEVDGFVTQTDNETWFGVIHPSVALKDYRQKMGIPSKNVVAAFTATNFTIADPADGGSLDVVGLDTSVPAVISDFLRG